MLVCKDVKRIAEAREFAIKKHAGQKYAEYPYEFHLDMVFFTLLKFGVSDIDILVASMLHDVEEDTDATFEEIERLFGIQVATIVHSVSGYGVNRKERFEDMSRKVQNLPKGAVLKAADRIANAGFSKTYNRDMYNKYRKEHDHFLLLMFKVLLDSENNQDYHYAHELKSMCNHLVNEVFND